MGRAYAQHVARQEAAARRRELEQYAADNPVYYNPVVHSGYDPDGLQELFGEDEIDWDGFDWDLWNWVVIGDEGEDGAVNVGSVADGAEIDFDYYRGDPLYQMAFANLDIDLDDIDIEDLKEATRYVVETYKMASNGEGWREPWEDPLPDRPKVTRLKTDYVTPFEIPGIVARAPGPQMSERLEGLKSRTTDATNYDMHKMRMAARGPQQGIKQKADPNWADKSWRPEGHPDRDKERTGIGAQYVLNAWAQGKTDSQILRKAENKGWEIGPKARTLLEGRSTVQDLPVHVDTF